MATLVNYTWKRFIESTPGLCLKSTTGFEVISDINPGLAFVGEQGRHTDHFLPSVLYVFPPFKFKMTVI